MHVFGCCAYIYGSLLLFFFFQAEDGIRDWSVTGVQTCALPIWVEPVGRARQKAEGDDDRIRRYDPLGTFERLRHAPTARIRLAEPGRHQLHALHLLGAHDLDRLSVEEKLDPLLATVLVVPPRAGHVALVAPVGAGHRLRALADRGAVAVHGGVPASEHDDSLAAQADERTGGAGKRELVAAVGDEIGQRLIHARQILAREAALHVAVGPHPEEHRVVSGHEILEGRIATDLAP